MINKKKYCSTCDKYILNKSSYNKTKSHTQLSSSVVNKYYIVDVPASGIDNIINKHIYDYTKKFLNFVSWCKIQNGFFCEKVNFAWISSPDIKNQGKKLTDHKCNQIEFVYIEIIFITDFQLPKIMIERKTCQIFDCDPNSIKILDRMPEPYERHTNIKHWGFQNEDHNGIICDFIPANRMDLQPNRLT